jgi:hypothetical protein
VWARGIGIGLVLGLLASQTAMADEPKLVAPGTERFSLDGYAELQLRGLSNDFRSDDWYLSQWAWILNLETDWNIAPGGWGPFDSISAFARVQVRYECVWTGCALANSWRYFGDRATKAPAQNWANGLSERFEGPIDLPSVGIPVGSLQDGLSLADITAAQHTSRAADNGIPQETIEAAFGPVIDDLFTYKRIDALGFRGIRDTVAPPLGPWRPESKIHPNGSLATKSSHVIGLPMRPATDSIYVPSARLREHLDDDDFGSFDQNFSQDELEWNHGASQDEWELKEVYLDLDLFDSRLWLRIGKQTIVWGKTELFRNQDQFNPVDVGLASLPSLEDSRIPLWSVRGIWSFYDVGPLEDVRLELAMNYDDFEPIDLGRCAEPYAVWLVCLKSAGLWGHGATGIGIAGEERPPDPWDSARGIEVGARVEFRWSAFSFAITDFYGYDDVAAAELFNEYARSVDVRTGRPLDTFGRPLDPDSALERSAGNRQLFEIGCEGSLGYGEAAALALTGGMGQTPDFSQQCQLSQPNVQDPFSIEAVFAGIPLSISVPFSNVLGSVLAGQTGGNLLFEALVNGADAAINGLLNGLTPRLAPLNQDPADGPSGGGFFGSDCTLPGVFCNGLGISSSNVSMYLTDEQEALLGCGPFFRTDCDVDGIDFYNAEASVLLQAFPGFEGTPVATRYENGRLFILPGARGPGDRGYDRRVDGTPPAGFHSEMEAASLNFAKFSAAIGIAQGDTGCDLDQLETCAAIRGFVALTGSRRPEMRAGGNGRFGRHDFLWHGGGELLLYYPKLNILGFSVDGTEDWTKSNWSAEFTWVNDRPFFSSTSSNLVQESDVYNLTISIDRPTFINFLNANRTFFFNAQFFVRYLPHYDDSYVVNGPFTLLGTLAITTGYFQDRLLPSLVLVHDLKSASGGVIAQASYRFNESFSATFGVLGFYGGPGTDPVPFHSVVLPNTMTDFTGRSRFAGLSSIAERDEVFLILRHTF